MIAWGWADWIVFAACAAVVAVWLVLSAMRWWRQRHHEPYPNGWVLDRIACEYGLQRSPGETDAQLRARCRAVFDSPNYNIAGSLNERNWRT